MDIPTTPKRQVQFTELDQQLTPPHTAVAKERASGVINIHDHGSCLPIRSFKFNTDTNSKTEEENKPREAMTSQNEELEALRKSEGTTHQSNTNDRPESDVQRWIHGATSSEQRRQRFLSVLHSYYPSNDEFNAARNPFYDPEEDGPYDEWLKYENWEGHCPYDDDDYNPFTDPSKSTEVWQPKIGDEGIENEEDLRMVLKARREHRARSRRFNRRKALYIGSQLDAGVKYQDIDMVQVFVGPEIEGEYDSYSDSDEEEDVEDPKPAAKTEASSAMTNPQTLGGPVLQPIIAAKGIRIFGAHETSWPRGRPRGSKNKKRGRRANKRKRGLDEKNPNSTYKYDADSEDEEPARKKGKKGKWVLSEAGARDEEWRAQTRAAARRDGHVGMDGNYDEDLDEDSESSMPTSSDTDCSSHSSDNTAEAIAVSHVAATNESNTPEERRGLLSRFASFLTG
ncbi:hypothetical protein F5Y10DRAFT_259880 [Nemania abortiva]|nr:hypothetical protein F5Y10DRAFT_259880 [Nemania abortiva]